MSFPGSEKMFWGRFLEPVKIDFSGSISYWEKQGIWANVEFWKFQISGKKIKTCVVMRLVKLVSETFPGVPNVIPDSHNVLPGVGKEFLECIFDIRKNP